MANAFREDELKLLPLSRLKPHEETTEGRTQKMVRRLKKDGVLKSPVLVEKGDFIVLDGHHRVEAFKRLGIKKIPCRVVDYDDPAIKVKPRRKSIPITKDIVRAKVRKGGVFPHKTTMHIYPGKRKRYNFKLEDLA